MAPPAAAPTGSAPDVPAGPLAGDAGRAQPDPLVGDDPLLGHDPLKGRAMPTQHSHWLRGRLREAQVTVLLNGVRYRSFSGMLDQDITMSLHRGANTVTFVYQPGTPESAGDLEIVEGEHHPPIAPLVTFHTRSSPDEGGGAINGVPLKPVTQTFPFIAN